jgi:hypothetical protein
MCLDGSDQWFAGSQNVSRIASPNATDQDAPERNLGNMAAGRMACVSPVRRYSMDDSAQPVICH